MDSYSYDTSSFITDALLNDMIRCNPDDYKSELFNKALSCETGHEGEKNYSLAFHYYKLLADLGNTQAQIKVANYYYEGLGVKKSLNESMFYLQKAAAENVPIAWDLLGDIYVSGVNGENSLEKAVFCYQKAFLAYKKQAELENVESQYALGRHYHLGLGVKKSYPQALYYYKLAAKQKNPYALIAIATMYELGDGVSQSFQKAFEYNKLAAEGGMVSAWIYVGDAYRSGKGVEKSEEKAYEAYQKTISYLHSEAAAGSPHAQYRLGCLYENGLGVQKSLDLSLKYYVLSAEQKYSLALCSLAECYLKGIGVEKSLDSAIHYYKIAADDGDALAKFQLAQLLLENKISENEAVEYLQQISTNKTVNQYMIRYVNFLLGECYEFGIGVNISYNKAFNYYTTAADLKLPQALEKLGDVYMHGKFNVKVSKEKASYYYHLAGIDNRSQINSKHKITKLNL